LFWGKQENGNEASSERARTATACAEKPSNSPAAASSVSVGSGLALPGGGPARGGAAREAEEEGGGTGTGGQPRDEGDARAGTAPPEEEPSYAAAGRDSAGAARRGRATRAARETPVLAGDAMRDAPVAHGGVIARLRGKPRRRRQQQRCVRASTNVLQAPERTAEDCAR
jgi:hypothetical protein